MEYSSQHFGIQKAACFLNVSPLFFKRLLKEGKIPFEKDGKSVLVKFSDIRKYERKQKAVRDKNLNFLTEQAQKLDLGY